MKSVCNRVVSFLDSMSSIKVFVFLMVVGFIVYFQASSYPFVHDDFIFIVENPQVKQVDGVKEIFLKPAAFEQGLGTINLYYRPVLDVLYKLQYQAFDLNPIGYHLTNILIHIINSFFIFWIVFFFLKRKKSAIFSGLLFLLHPVQSESVCAIAGVSNLLMTFFCLLSFISYLYYRKSVVKNKNLFLVYSVFLFFAALLTKERAVVFPLLILTYEIAMSNFKSISAGIKQIFLKTSLFFIVLFGYFYFRRLALGKSLPSLGSNLNELVLRVLSIPQTLLEYFKILIFPTDLHYYRSHDILQTSIWASVGFFVLLFALIFAIKFFLKRDKRVAVFGLFWFFISLLPVLNIIPLINEYSFILTSEHFLYFSFLGFALVLLVFLREIRERISLKNFNLFLCSFFIGVVVILSALTVHQNHYWRGEIPLFERTLEFEERFGRIRILLARAYYFDQSYDKAIEEYEKAFEIMDGYTRKTKGTEVYDVYQKFIKEIYFDLAHCYSSKMDFSRSIDQYNKVLILDPQNSEVYNNIGINYFYLNDIDQAISYFSKALEIDPGNILAKRNLSLCHEQEKK